MKKILYIILTIIVTGCSQKKTEPTNIISLSKSNTPLNLSDHFSNSNFRSLQSNEPIGTIDKIAISNSHILVSDFYIMKSLKVFDKNGFLLVARDDIGEGPFGMSEITDFNIYNDTIYVLDANKRKFYRFDLELNNIDELNIPFACNNFSINKEGFFLLKQGLDAIDGRIMHFNHKMEFLKSILPSNEAETPIVVSNNNLFTTINDSSFIFNHPFFPNLWIYKNKSFIKIDLDFKNQFIDAHESSKMEPLDRLNFVNEFQGYYNITNGVKLNENEILYSIRYRKKSGYLKINLNNMNMVYYENLKNDLLKVPSTISFSGNTNKEAWYWMNQEDITKFYQLNNFKIPENDRITLDSDLESKIVFNLNYK